MSHQMKFQKEYVYDTRDVGITLPVVLSYGDQEVEFLAKVDTGADYCIFKREHGEALGLTIEQGDRLIFNTVTGSFEAYGFEINISVLGISFYSNVYFAADHNHPRNVLGRQGWINRLRIGIVDYEAKIYLSEYGDELSEL